MDEDAIIRNRLIDERALKRLTRRFSSLKDEADFGAVEADFVAFEAGLLRIQLQWDASQREEARYDKDLQTLIAKAPEEEKEIERLQILLRAAEEEKLQKQSLDEIAHDILRKQLPSRDAAHAEIQRLQDEIQRVKGEGEMLQSEWGKRRDAFAQVIASLERLQAVTKHDEGREDGEMMQEDQVMTL